MGIRSVLQREPLAVVREMINSPAEQLRRAAARRRLALYRDNSEQALREELHRVFQSPIVRRKIDPFLKLACSSALYRRIVDDVAKHTYNPPPTRKISNERDGIAWAAFEKETRFNRRMDLVARLTKAQNAVGVFPIYSQRTERITLHVLTQDQCFVVPDPDDPTQPLAIVYDAVAWSGDPNSPREYVYWDDSETFRFSKDFQIRPGSQRVNEDGFIPAEFVHLKERVGDEFWDITTGMDVEAAHLSVALLHALRLRLHKSQGERVLKAEGSTAGLQSGQVLDAEEILKVPEGVTLGTLDLATSPQHYLDSIQDIVATTGANHGLSRERINAKGGDPGSDLALIEQRAEIVTVFAEGEQRLFELFRKMSRYYPDPARRISDDAKLEVDYHALEARTSKRDQIEIWDLKEQRGLSNYAELVMAENPELRTQEEAIERFESNMEMRARRIELERRLNTSGEPGNPGPSPQENGAMGPAARNDDGLPPGNGARGVDQGNAPRRGEGT